MYSRPPAAEAVHDSCVAFAAGIGFRGGHQLQRRESAFAAGIRFCWCASAFVACISFGGEHRLSLVRERVGTKLPRRRSFLLGGPAEMCALDPRVSSAMVGFCHDVKSVAWPAAGVWLVCDIVALKHSPALRPRPLSTSTLSASSLLSRHKVYCKGCPWHLACPRLDITAAFSFCSCCLRSTSSGKLSASTLLWSEAAQPRGKIDLA